MVGKGLNAVRGFFKDVKSELLKVTFPSRHETIGSTMVVIIFTVIVALYLAGVDIILVRLLRLAV